MTTTRSAEDFKKQIDKVSNLAQFDVLAKMDPVKRKDIEEKLKGGVSTKDLNFIQKELGDLIKNMGPGAGTNAQKDANTAQMEFLAQYQKATAAATTYTETTEKAISTLQGEGLIDIMRRDKNTVTPPKTGD